MPTNNLFASLKKIIQKLLPQSLPPDPNEPVTIATFQPVMRPHVDLLRSRLEAEGITCMINGDWHTHADFVRLQVRRADVVEASALLEEIEAS